MTTERTSAGQERGAPTDERIVGAALDLLRSHGPAAVNIESISTASGVAKTTIYRRYSDRAALLRAAVQKAAIDVPIPTDLSTYDTVRWLLRKARATAEDMVGRGVIATILVDDDPDFTALLHEMIKARSASLTTLLRERVAAGDLRPDLDVDLVAGLLLGAFVGEVIRGHDPDDQWADTVLALLWPTLSP